MNYQHQQNTGPLVITETSRVALLLTYLPFLATINAYVIQGNGQYVLPLYGGMVLS